jgi:O-antigen chain-terminating methyltransferase
LIRLLWPQISHQIAANALIVDQLRQVQSTSESFKQHAENVVAHLKSLQEQANSVVIERDAVLEQVELAKRQAFITHHEGISAIRKELSELTQLIAEKDALNRRFENALANFRIQIAQMNLFVDELKRSRPHTPAPERISAVPSAFDALYPAFEDAFRGSEELIRERVAIYVDDFLKVPNRGPVLDIGCGRGELLEVLRSASIEAYGIDINEAHVNLCQERGLDVRHEDALSHLDSVPPGSLGGITAIQLVEHITVEDVIELIDRAIAALQPGGLLILETPNPDNLTVGASSFYLDPTHEKPLPPQLLGFLAGSRGLVDVEIRELHRDELEVLAPSLSQPWSQDLLPLIDALNRRLFSPQDYAVIGRRP